MVLNNALAIWQGEVEVITVGQTLAQVKAKALLYTLANRLEELKVQTLRDTLAEEKGKGLVNTMTHRLEEEEAETHWEKFRSRFCSTLNVTGLVL